jgi:hypothetical protein
MTSAEYDLSFLEAGIDQLENYLLSKDIYRPIGIKAPSGLPPYPQLTLGWLLLALLRARSASLSSAQETRLHHLTTQLEAIQSHWRTAWTLKAQAEFRARLNLWRDFLNEFRQSPAGNIDRYAYEVTRRVLLQLLQEEAQHLPEPDLQALSGLDHWLKAIFAPGSFVWDEHLMPGFPEATYWYLYGAPKAYEGDRSQK